MLRRDEVQMGALLRYQGVDATGAVVVTGSAGEVWAWVHGREVGRG